MITPIYSAIAYLKHKADFYQLASMFLRRLERQALLLTASFTAETAENFRRQSFAGGR